MRKLLVSVFFIFLLSSVKAQPVFNLYDAIDAYLTERFPADQPGVAVFVGRDTNMIFFQWGYGLADLKTNKNIDTRTVFNLGSVSKTFVAYGILKLQEEGKLSIEDPILKYFPQFKNKTLVKDIKIKHLLSHSSGLPDSRPVEKDSVFYLTAKDAENWAPILQTDKLNFQPGEKYEYSNPAFNGLALIIEKVSGMKWQQYLQKKIIQPSGMKNTVITDGAFPDKGVSHAYQMIDGKWSEYDYGEYPTFCASGNGGVWSNVEDLFKYEIAIQKNTFLSKESIELSRTIFNPPNWKSDQAPFIGYSWFLTSSAGYKMQGHTGDQGGFRADYVYLPEKKFFIAILSNGSHDLLPIRNQIIKYLKLATLL